MIARHDRKYFICFYTFFLCVFIFPLHAATAGKKQRVCEPAGMADCVPAEAAISRQTGVYRNRLLRRHRAKDERQRDNIKKKGP